MNAYTIPNITNDCVRTVLARETQAHYSLYEIIDNSYINFGSPNDLVTKWQTHPYGFVGLGICESIWHPETFNYCSFQRQFASYRDGNEYAFTPTCWRDYMKGHSLWWDDELHAFCAEEIVAHNFETYIRLLQNRQENDILHSDVLYGNINSVIDKHKSALSAILNDDSDALTIRDVYDEYNRERRILNMFTCFYHFSY